MLRTLIFNIEKSGSNSFTTTLRAKTAWTRLAPVGGSLFITPDHSFILGLVFVSERQDSLFRLRGEKH